MFDIMKKRTMRRICLPLVLGLLVALVVTSFVVVRFYWTTFTDSADNAVEQQERNVQLYLNLMAETARQFTKITENQEPGTPAFEDLLNAKLLSLIQRDESILGAAYILPDGHTLASQYVTGYPSLDALRQVPAIEAFIQSREEIQWIVRTEQLAEVYDKYPYDSAKGMVTLLTRVRVNDRESGYLFIDIDPRHIVNYFSSMNGAHIDAAILMEGSGFLQQSDSLFSDPSFARKVQQETQSISHLEGQRVYRLPFGSHTIVVAVSTGGVTSQIISFLVPMLLLFLLLSSASVLISRRLTRSLSDPLERLYRVMNEERLEPVLPSAPAKETRPDAASPPGDHTPSAE